MKQLSDLTLFSLLSNPIENVYDQKKINKDEVELSTRSNIYIK